MNGFKIKLNVLYMEESREEDETLARLLGKEDIMPEMDISELKSMECPFYQVSAILPHIGNEDYCIVANGSIEYLVKGNYKEIEKLVDNEILRITKANS